MAAPTPPSYLGSIAEYDIADSGNNNNNNHSFDNITLPHPAYEDEMGGGGGDDMHSEGEEGDEEEDDSNEPRQVPNFKELNIIPKHERMPWLQVVRSSFAVLSVTRLSCSRPSCSLSLFLCLFCIFFSCLPPRPSFFLSSLTSHIHISPSPFSSSLAPLPFLLSPLLPHPG